MFYLWKIGLGDLALLGRIQTQKQTEELEIQVFEFTAGCCLKVKYVFQKENSMQKIFECMLGF